MKIEEAYKEWSKQYDGNKNRTRDAEALVLRKLLSKRSFDNVLELGCGTGKNTSFLLENAKKVLAVDLTEEMLALARAKITSSKVEFIKADLTEEWSFVSQKADLVTFSLVLEHIENLNSVFQKVAQNTVKGAFLYVGELHPFKQYSGSQA
jgi:ubiquinone/menaquinone biosynthesis C-methylase UbiE